MKKTIFSLLAGALCTATMLQAKPTVPYEKVTIDAAYASSEYITEASPRVITNIIDGSGITDGKHSTTATHAWMASNGSQTFHTVILSLAAAEPIIGMHIWNGNMGTTYNNRGVKDFEIYYSTSQDDMSSTSFDSWTLLRTESLAMASGTADYAGEYKDLAGLPQNVRWIGFKITSNQGGDWGYTMLSEVELYRSMTASATLSGNAAMVAGSDPVSLQVTLSGTAPFNLTYTDGATNTDVVTNENQLAIPVAPNTTTTYSLVSLSDANGAGTVAGEATVTVYGSANVIDAEKDGFIRQSDNKSFWGLLYTEVKNGASFNRRAVYAFDISTFTSPLKSAAFGVYYDRSNPKGSVGEAVVSGFVNGNADVLAGLSEETTWDSYTALTTNLVSVATSAITENDSCYLLFDVTNHLNALLAAGETKMVLELNGLNTSSLFIFSTVESTNPPGLFYIETSPSTGNAAVAATNMLTLLSTQGGVTLQNSGEATAFAIYNTTGARCHSGTLAAGSATTISHLPVGIYIVRTANGAQKFTIR